MRGVGGGAVGVAEKQERRAGEWSEGGAEEEEEAAALEAATRAFFLAIYLLFEAGMELTIESGLSEATVRGRKQPNGERPRESLGAYVEGEAEDKGGRVRAGEDEGEGVLANVRKEYEGRWNQDFKSGAEA